MLVLARTQLKVTKPDDPSHPDTGPALLRQFSTTSDEGTHDDFKPKIKGDAPPSIAEQIEADVKSHSVFVYMKGVPQAPMCGFSNMACRILDAYGTSWQAKYIP